MKVTLFTVLLLCAGSAFGADHVRGHVRKDGTYVPPHYRTSPDDSRTNNWSSQGNVNPYTGERGTVDPYAPKQPTYPTYPDYSRQRSR